ncbi:MAG: lipopolysaccharide biosynthesis protein [Planctomycetota bacterium]
MIYANDETNHGIRCERDPSALPTSRERDKRAVRGGVLTTMSKMVLFVVSIGSAMVVARLLTPSEFGLFAMSAVLFGLLMKLRNLGWIEAVVQAQDLDEPTLSALFWRNAKFNILILLLSLIAAPFMAWLFGEPDLVLVVVAVACISFGRGLSGIHEGVLRRQVRYSDLVRIDVIAVVLSTAVVIIAAYSGLSYWALVLQEAVRELLAALLMVWFTRWLPRLKKRTPEIQQRLKAMTGYSLNISGAMVINYVGLMFGFVLVGKFFGTAPLGIYEKAFKWSRMPFQQFYIPISKVAMSKFSRLQDSPKAYSTSVFRTVLALYSVITPLFTVLFTEAHHVIMILFGPQWGEVIPLFQILIVGTLFASIFQIVRSILKAEGRATTIMRWTLVFSPTMLIASCIGAYWGVTGVAIAYTSAAALLFLPTIWVCAYGGPLNAWTIVRAIWPPVLCCVFASAVVHALREVYSSLPGLIVIVISGSLIVFLATAVFVLLPGGMRRLHELRIAFEPLREKKTSQKPCQADPTEATDGRS